MYLGTKLPRWYIGSSTEEKVLNGYNGSVCSKRYCEIYIKEQKENKHLFKTRILSKHLTRKEAISEELRLQKMHKVVKNSDYFNESYAQKNGCFSREKFGELNPMFNKGYKLTGDKNGRHKNNFNYQTSNIGENISRALKLSEKNKKENNPASKKYYIKYYNEFKDIPKGYLYQFCEEMNIKYTTVYCTLYTKKPVTKGSAKGYQLFEGTYE
jgi:dTDP-4-amino-4,6-dideoxygalactose transaminase